MRILVIDPLWEDQPDLETEAAGAGVELVWRRSRDGRLPPEDEGDYALADGVLNCRSAHRLPEEIIARLTRCRCIAQGGVGFGHVDLDAAGSRGIPVLNTPDYGTTEVADHAVALALALLRGVQAYDRRLRRSNESWDARQLRTVRRLGGLRVGILGLGRIGTAAALRFERFGMEVGYYDPYQPVGHNLSFGWRRFATQEEMLARSDVLSIHAPLSAETRSIIDARALALLPEGAVLINTARGALVDFDAVHAALRSGHLGAAGLDVFDPEPLDRTHPLVAAWAAGEPWLDERLVLTPHSAFYSTASIRDIRRLSMTYLIDYMRRGRMPTCVNTAQLRNPRGPYPAGLMRARDASGIAELEWLARRRLPGFVRDYLHGAAGDGATLRRNRAALDAIGLVPRSMLDVAGASLAGKLLGRDSRAPIAVAPMGVAGMMRPGADLMLARAAAEAGIPYALSAAGNVPMEDVARIGGRPWMQVYPMRDKAAIGALARRADAAGFEALLVTVDTPVGGVRYWQRRHFRADGTPRLRTRLDALRHTGWALDALRHGEPAFPNIAALLPEGARDSRAVRQAINAGKDPSFVAEELPRLRDDFRGQVIVKGVLAPEDVARVAALGMDAVVLSNHGGRQLDGAVSPLEMLPDCLAAAGRLPVLVDGGFRSGTDVVKALALGAAGVLLGRAFLYGVAAGGQEGAARAMDLIIREAETVLALLGCRSAAELGPQHIRRAPLSIP